MIYFLFDVLFFFSQIKKKKVLQIKSQHKLSASKDLVAEAIKLYSVGQFTGVISITPGNIGITELILISLQKLYVYKTSEILAISLVGRVADYILLVLLNFFVKKTD